MWATIKKHPWIALAILGVVGYYVVQAETRVADDAATVSGNVASTAKVVVGGALGGGLLYLLWVFLL